MVGFITEPTIEEDLNQVPKLKNFNDQLDTFEPKITDFSFADSLLDFNSIKDWFEDIPIPDMDDPEKVGVGVAEERIEMVGDQIVHGSDPIIDGSESVGVSGCAVKVETGEGANLGNLGCSIEEEMRKFSLVSGSSGGLAGVEGNGEKSEIVSDGDKSESDSAESESSSSSASSSSSSSDDDDEEEEEEANVEVKREADVAGEVEEGEIRDSDDGEEMVGRAATGDDDDNDNVGEMVSWSDIDDEGGGEGDAVKGPIRSKNEFEVLPPVPPVDVTLQPCHQMLSLGVVLSVVGAQVIVEGVEKHNPLNESSILWITVTRSPLGLVDEIFGPVKNPYYVVRYNSENEVPDGICAGTSISFVPDFANHVLNDKNLYKKGYDASGENDEEVSDEAEFSDDEKEAKYKRMLKMTKSGTNDQRLGNRANNGKKVKNRDVQQTSMVGQLRPNQNKHHVLPSALDPRNRSSSSFGVGQGFAGGMGLVPPSHQMTPTTGFIPPSNQVWTNGMPCQRPQSAVFPSGFPTDGRQWLSQNYRQHPFQMPMPNGIPYQQQLNPSLSSLPNFGLPVGRSNFIPGLTYATLPGLVGQNGLNQTTFGMGLQGQSTHPSTHSSVNVGQGTLSNGLRMEQNFNFQPPVIPSNIVAPQKFNLGASSSRGRKPYRQGGGRFAGRRD